MTREFVAWPKIARLNRDMTITEKIDGTNACIIITEDDMYAQSRTRVITPDGDNFGFASWVKTWQDELRVDLGIGRHFGEWWGSGIQRKYGLTDGERRFSPFNTHRFSEKNGYFSTPGVATVPVLYDGPWSDDVVNNELRALRDYGSVAAPGFMNPEGVVIFHNAAHVAFKVTLEGDDVPKGQQ
jgi:hypothetical protein